MSKRRKPNRGAPARTHAPAPERMVVRDRATALGESARAATAAARHRDQLRETYLAGLDEQMAEVGRLEPLPAGRSMTVNSVVPAREQPPRPVVLTTWQADALAEAAEEAGSTLEELWAPHPVEIADGPPTAADRHAHGGPGPITNGPGDLTITVDDHGAEERRRRAVEEYLAGGGGRGPGAAGQGMRA